MTAFDPDVVLNLGLCVETPFLQKFVSEETCLAATMGLPQLAAYDLDPYDIVITHMPGLADRIKPQGHDAVLVRLGFRTGILDDLDEAEDEIPISFVGGLTHKHGRRITVLEHFCQELPMQIWAPDLSSVDEDSPIRDCYQGQAWGIDMYDIMHRSKVTLNVHIDGVEVATNGRLFEATGVGTALVTDALDGLEDIFEPGEEVLTYDDPSECVATIERLLDDPQARERIASAGQNRTLSEHTCRHRAEAIVEAIQGVS